MIQGGAGIGGHDLTRPLDHGTLILGMPGTGKTVWGEILCRYNYRTHGCRYLVHDPTGKILPQPGLEVRRNCDPEDVALEAITTGGGVSVLFDEAHEGFSREDPPKKGTALRHLVFKGRNAQFSPWGYHDPICWIAVAHSAWDLHRTVRGAACVLFAGRMEEPFSLGWIKSRAGREAARAVSRLEKPVPGRVEAVFLRYQVG